MQRQHNKPSSLAVPADYGGASDDEGAGRDAWGAMQADEGDDGDLLSPPRKVANTTITYARASKQVQLCAQLYMQQHADCVDGTGNSVGWFKVVQP